MECRLVPSDEHDNYCNVHDQSWTKCMQTKIAELKAEKIEILVRVKEHNPKLFDHIKIPLEHDCPAELEAFKIDNAKLDARVIRLERRVAEEQERCVAIVNTNRKVTKMADAASGRDANTRQPTGCTGAVEALVEEFNKLKTATWDSVALRDALESLVAEQGMCNDIETARGYCAGHPGLMRLPCPVKSAREALASKDPGKLLLDRMFELDRTAAEFEKAKLELSFLRAMAEAGMEWVALTAGSSVDEAAEVCGRLSNSLKTWHDWKKIP